MFGKQEIIASVESPHVILRSNPWHGLISLFSSTHRTAMSESRINWITYSSSSFSSRIFLFFMTFTLPWNQHSNELLRLNLKRRACVISESRQLTDFWEKQNYFIHIVIIDSMCRAMPWNPIQRRQMPTLSVQLNALHFFHTNAIVYINWKQCLKASITITLRLVR